MSILKRFDAFRALNSEYRESNVLGTVISLISIVAIVFLFSKEIRTYKNKSLETNLYIQNLHLYTIHFEFDIILMSLSCETVNVFLKLQFEDLNLRKEEFEGRGCRISGKTEVKHMDNIFMIQPTNDIGMMDFIVNSFGGASNFTPLDLSHKILKFQFGRSLRHQTEISELYPHLLKTTPLSGQEYHGSSKKDGHYLFIYDINLVTAKINSSFEIVYNYSKNELSAQSSVPQIIFYLDFSPIAMEYRYSNENFLEFLTYLIGILGGVIGLVKLLTNLLGTYLFKKDTATPSQVFEM